jgi:hypothetical protein
VINNLGDPRLVASRCAEAGAAIATLGVPPQRLEALAILLVDALRANPPAPPLRAEEEAALRDAGRLIARWTAAAAGDPADPVLWSAEIVEHDRRRADMAVLRLRTYLPYPCPPGMRAVVESPHVPGLSRDCWVGNLPNTDRTVELHIALHRADPVGAALVERTAVGDRVRLHLPVGAPVPLGIAEPYEFFGAADAHESSGPRRPSGTSGSPPSPFPRTGTSRSHSPFATTAASGSHSPFATDMPPGTSSEESGRADTHAGLAGRDRPLLLIAERDAIAPIAAALRALRSVVAPDVQCDITVYWPSAVERDVYRLADIAPAGTAVIRDRFTPDGRVWSGHTAFIAGTAASTANDADRVRRAGVPPEHTVVAAIG